MIHAPGHKMTPTRIQQALPAADSVVAFGAVTLTSIALDLVAPMNLILMVLFIVSIFANFGAGLLKAFAVHRRSAAKGDWFSSTKASIGMAKKMALMLFVVLAAIVDSMFAVWGPTSGLGDTTPTVKGVLVALTGVQVMGAARSLHEVVGDEAIPALNVLIRAIDNGRVQGGRVPARKEED